MRRLKLYDFKNSPENLNFGKIRKKHNYHILTKKKKGNANP